MVNKPEAGSEGMKPMGLFQALEGLTPGMWLELLKGFGNKEAMDPVKLTELVKKIIESSSPKEGSPLAHAVKILSKHEPTKPVVHQEGAIKEQVTEQARPRPMPIAKLPEGALPPRPQNTFIDRAVKTPEPQQMPKLEAQIVVGTVLKALYALLPSTPNQDAPPPPVDDPVVPVKEGANTEFMAKGEEAPAPQKPQAKPEAQTEATPTAIKMEAKPLEMHKVDPKPEFRPTEKMAPKLSEMGLTPNLRRPQEGEMAFKPQTPAPQPMIQAPKAEQTIIPGAPYSYASPLDDLRRKEKKRRRNPWEPEDEDEEDPAKKYPRDTL